MKRQRMKHQPGKKYTPEEAAERKRAKQELKAFYQRFARAGFSSVMVASPKESRVVNLRRHR